MKEDYLWDKSGDPDPEIQELERVLGTLRYQPRPLEIPAGLTLDCQRTFPSRLLAIAATVAIMLLGAGLWFGLQTRQTSEVAEGGNKSGLTGSGPESVAVAPKTTSTPTPVVSILAHEEPIRHRVNPGELSRKPAVSRRPRLNIPELTAQERQEAEAAKEQLMLALRVASSKLNVAQKKVREINSENQTHNQHKVG